MIPPRRCLTPPALAAHWGVKPETVLRFIRSGELRAFNVASRHGSGRPRYRISPDAVIEFENRRAAKQENKRPIRRRRLPHVIEFF